MNRPASLVKGSGRSCRGLRAADRLLGGEGRTGSREVGLDSRAPWAKLLGEGSADGAPGRGLSGRRFWAEGSADGAPGRGRCWRRSSHEVKQIGIYLMALQIMEIVASNLPKDALICLRGTCKTWNEAMAKTIRRRIHRLPILGLHKNNCWCLMLTPELEVKLANWVSIMN
jgi:hypothetical protein